MRKSRPRESKPNASPIPVYLILDTNVIVSSLLKEGSLPHLVVEGALKGLFSFFYSEAMMLEYESVLKRPKFGFGADAEILLSVVRTLGEKCAPKKTEVPLPDPDDRVFYDVYQTLHKVHPQTYLVSGNLRHYPREENIVSPREFLEIVGII